jgi:hypothetical protein
LNSIGLAESKRIKEMAQNATISGFTTHSVTPADLRDTLAHDEVRSIAVAGCAFQVN